MTGDPDIYAWVGEDELGSGEIGIKQAYCPAGLIPLVSTNLEKISSASIKEQLQFQADKYGKEIRLVRYSAEHNVLSLSPADEQGA